MSIFEAVAWGSYCKRVSFLVTICLVITAQRSHAQQTSSDVLTILRASLAAQAGKETVQDITLTGNVESIAGSDDETVPFTFKGTLSGSARTDIQLSSGTLTEIRTIATSGPTGTWSRGDDVQHPISGHNLMTDPAWCSPVLIVERLLSNPAVMVSYLGTEDGLAHFQANQPVPTGTVATSTSLVQHLGQVDLYLDPKTFLPVKLSLNTHPDDNALLDLPVLIEFSNYQAVSGVTVPMHVQKQLNGTLALDVQVQNVAVNSGLSQSNF